MNDVRLFSVIFEGFHREDTDQELRKVVADMAKALEKAGYAIALSVADWSAAEGNEQDLARAQTMPSAPRFLHIERAQAETAADAEPEPEPGPGDEQDEPPAGEPDEGVAGADTPEGAPESEPPAGEANEF
jgi:hypothetical protein